MATISPRTDDEGNRIGWQARVRKKGFPPQVRTFRKKVEAETWAKSIEAEMERGVWQDRSESEATTLKEALERYRKEKTSRKAVSGIQPESSKIDQWQKRKISHRPLSSIRGKDVAQAIEEMETEGKGPNTVRLHLAVLSHLFTVARTEWGMENLVNPVELAKGRKPRLPSGRDRRLEPGEEERLLEACRTATGPWLLPVVRFALETGMRLGEIVETWGKNPEKTRAKSSDGLAWKHVDLQARTAFLPKTKNGSERTVPLSSAAVQILADLPRSLNGRAFPVTGSAIEQAFERACRRAGINDFRFHDLRHEATSRFFEKGLNPMQVAAITGHKTLQMLKRYTHLRAEDLAKLLA